MQGVPSMSLGMRSVYSGMRFGLKSQRLRGFCSPVMRSYSGSASLSRCQTSSSVLSLLLCLCLQVCVCLQDAVGQKAATRLGNHPSSVSHRHSSIHKPLPEKIH